MHTNTVFSAALYAVPVIPPQSRHFRACAQETQPHVPRQVHTINKQMRHIITASQFLILKP
jgi:hypothetical protein